MILDDELVQRVDNLGGTVGLSGVLAPSASGRGIVLAAFENRIGPGALSLRESEPLSPKRYRELVKPA